MQEREGEAVRGGRGRQRLLFIANLDQLATDAAAEGLDLIPIRWVAAGGHDVEGVPAGLVHCRGLHLQSAGN